MIWTNFVPAVVPNSHEAGSVQKSGIRRGRLSRVWIETGNPKQPLAGIWIDDALPVAPEEGDEEPRPEWIWPMNVEIAAPNSARWCMDFLQTGNKGDGVRRLSFAVGFAPFPHQQLDSVNANQYLFINHS